MVQLWCEKEKNSIKSIIFFLATTKGSIGSIEHLSKLISKIHLRSWNWNRYRHWHRLRHKVWNRPRQKEINNNRQRYRQKMESAHHYLGMQFFKTIYKSVTFTPLIGEWRHVFILSVTKIKCYFATYLHQLFFFVTDTAEERISIFIYVCSILSVTLNELLRI